MLEKNSVYQSCMKFDEIMKSLNFFVCDKDVDKIMNLSQVSDLSNYVSESIFVSEIMCTHSACDQDAVNLIAQVHSLIIF